MFKKIVWATDGSESADRALPLAKSLASNEGASLLVLHASSPSGGEDDPRQSKIAEQVKELTDAGVNASLTVVSSEVNGPAHALAEAAREEGAEVIVMGTRGHTPLTGLLLGSVTQRLLHIAPCPVLVVPAGG
jgi:nucleotide-binding universal stress UspA family protein